ncbi:short-chain fatty acyl-CoA regulator family protein [Brevirhabdus sp.]|uniref:short-chain fatty acyl-CoA regulator family protein n=1 Tax=Brevirhabdus sp. TaxID=2004514 RepID=UPI004059C105
MPTKGITGKRIRERRLLHGMKQAELAAEVGISASYLNLIEHDRRRIGGKLLLEIARRLDADVSALTEGAQAELLDGLRSAAAYAGEQSLDRRAAIEVAASEQLAGRFPGWAGLIVSQSQQIAMLERSLEGLSDRLAHDPFLSESLHAMLSSVTAIRSTASILRNTPNIDEDWRKRFQANIFDDSTRLAETSQALVSWFDTMAQRDVGFATPLERAEALLDARGHHLPELEENPDGAADLARDLAAGQSAAFLSVVQRIVTQYAALSRALPLGRVRAALSRLGFDPGALAQDLGAPPHDVLRRLATLPPGPDVPQLGLIQCDAAGALTFRRRLEGFAMPKFGAACALWPLFQALHMPLTPLSQRVEMPGGQVFDTYSVAWHSVAAQFGRAPVCDAVMLVVPTSDASSDSLSDSASPERAADARARRDAAPVGGSCRLCPREVCAARREPSIVLEGL